MAVFLEPLDTEWFYDSLELIPATNKSISLAKKFGLLKYDSHKSYISPKEKWSIQNQIKHFP